MVETHAAARETERHGDETTYAYTPHELNQMLSREVAGRLRELADTLDANAAFLFASTAVPAAFARPRLRAYLDVSSQLRAVARHEIETANVRVVTR
ncbi:hypothetical protein [Amycolatopsis orientalis]|uniref:hypothetical protein n=1 Tax=Amycolatopsis orientalis TaxID=31958 RepID=UPI0003A8C778|nr:hypothetical protein [Amycolatopsis orientalis]